MTELQTLLFGKPHPLPVQKVIDPEVGSYGKRSCNYGRAVSRVREAIREMGVAFTVKEVATATTMDRGTVNRALIKLAGSGVVEKTKGQTAGAHRGSAIWSKVTSSPP